MAEKASDPYSVLLKSNKLPMSLLETGSEVPGLKQHQAKMTIETSSYADTFGPKSQRKRVKLGVSSIADLAEDTETSMDAYKERLEQARLLSGAGESNPDGQDGDDPLSLAIEPVFSKGTSKRIWNELYKVLDSSDVVLHLLGKCSAYSFLYAPTVSNLVMNRCSEPRRYEMSGCGAVLEKGSTTQTPRLHSEQGRLNTHISSRKFTLLFALHPSVRPSALVRILSALTQPHLGRYLLQRWKSKPPNLLFSCLRTRELIEFRFGTLS